MILGIDPGLASTGFCILDGKQGRCWTAKTSPDSALDARLWVIGQALRQVLATSGLSLVAIEGYTYQGARTHTRAALILPRLIGYLEGIARADECEVMTIPRGEILWSLTGKRGSPKAMVKKALEYRKLTGGKNEHERDALAVAYVAGLKREVAYVMRPFGGIGR